MIICPTRGQCPPPRGLSKEGPHFAPRCPLLPRKASAHLVLPQGVMFERKPHAGARRQALVMTFGRPGRAGMWGGSIRDATNLQGPHARGLAEPHALERVLPQRKRPPTGKPDPYTSMCVVISGLWQLALSYLLPPLWMGWPRRASLQDDVQHLMWFCLQEIV